MKQIANIILAPFRFIRWSLEKLFNALAFVLAGLIGLTVALIWIALLTVIGALIGGPVGAVIGFLYGLFSLIPTKRCCHDDL